MLSGNHTTTRLNELFALRSSNPAYILTKRQDMLDIQTRYNAMEDFLYKLLEKMRESKRNPEEARAAIVVWEMEIVDTLQIDPILSRLRSNA